MNHPYPPLNYKTWDEYAIRICNELGYPSPSYPLILDVKCLMMDCFKRTLDKECKP